jgi:hypothetical protein
MKHPVRFEGLGPPGMARRFVEAAPAPPSPDRLERAREVLTEASAKVAAKAPDPPSGAKSPLAKEARRGRPKVEGEGPWVAAGVSRRTWYRRRAEEERGPA